MKPERGGAETDEMEADSDKDPRDVLQELVLEVLEGRVPDPSNKGRVEGPHCPQSEASLSHACSEDVIECRRVFSLEKHLDMLWRNNIPVCMDVLLFPDCCHGRRESQFVEVCGAGGVESGTDNCLLLERWTFKFCQKRVHADKSCKRSVGPTMLLQAIKSYLHFSQLSSWLLSTSGCLPLVVVHRLYAPGENVGYDFVENPDQHKFPSAHHEQYGIKVSVSSLPRQDIVNLQCKFGEDKLLQKRIMRENKQKEEEAKQNERGRSLKRTRNHQSEMTRKRENRRYPIGYLANLDKSSNSTNRHMISETVSSNPEAEHIHENVSHFTNTDHNPPRSGNISENSVNHFRNYHNASAYNPDINFQAYRDPTTTISKTFSSENHKAEANFLDYRLSETEYLQKLRTNSPSRNIFKDKLLPLSPDTHLQVDTASAATKCLHSPKVLMTSNTKPDQIFKKKCLDLSTSSDSDEWENQYTSMKIKDLASPLSPSDIQSYLASLQTVACTNVSNSTTKFSSTPKCKFYVGSEVDTSIDNGYQSGSKGQIHPLRSVTPSLSQSDISNIENDAHNLFSDDLESVMRKLQGFSPYHSESPPTKKEKKDLSVTKSKCANRIESNSKQVSPRETHKRKYCEESQSVRRDLNFEDSGLVTGDIQSTNGHVSCDNSKNGVIPSHDVPAKCRSPEAADVGQSEDLLCNNCDKPRNVRLSCLRKFPTTPTLEDTATLRHHMTKSASMMFSSRTGLPTQSSPAPIKRKSLGRFDYDSSLTSTRAIKNALSCSKLVLNCATDTTEEDNTGRVLSTSAPASTNCLLGNFEESVLNGRIEPIGAVDGFTAEIGASGSFCPKHVTLPVTSYFFKLSDDNAPSPYLGHINLESLGKKGYHIPKRGTVQVTLFNPNRTVIKMFVVMYDLSDMPANCQTFMRQRTLYMPGDPNSGEPSFLRYLIHLRFATSKSGKVYLHTDIRLIFARDKFEFDPKVAQYELRSFNEGPRNPKFSPKR